MTILCVRPEPTYFTHFSSKLQKITKFSMVLLVNKTKLYWDITFIIIDKFMTKYSTELSEVYVQNRGIAHLIISRKSTMLEGPGGGGGAGAIRGGGAGVVSPIQG